MAAPKDLMSDPASPSHPRAERSSRRRLRQRVGAAMPTKKTRLLTVAMAGGLALTGATAAAIANIGHTPTHAALAANMASSPPANLDNCPMLAEGYHGGCINQLQTELNTDNGTNMPVDGIFGPETKKAVELFQQNHDIAPADGIVGPQTKAALDNPDSNSVTPPTSGTPVTPPTSGTPVTPPTSGTPVTPPTSGTPVTPPTSGTPVTPPTSGTPVTPPTSGTPVTPPTSGTSDGSGAAKYTRMAHSFFGDKACISGYCAPIGQSHLWYDSTDPSGLNLRRIQLNWADPERPCSTWIDFDAWNTSGTTRYWHIQGDTHTGCRFSDGLYAFNDGTDDIPPNTQAIVCGTLYRAGNPQPKLLTRTCVYVG